MKSLLLRQANWLIASLLVLAGYGVIRWHASLEGLDISAASSLAGALFGASALFVGAEINKWDQRSRAQIDLEEKQRRVRSALLPELVRISVNHIESAKYFRMAVEEISSRGGLVDMGIHVASPEVPFIYNALLTQITLLQEREIDALGTFYGGLNQTREAVRQCSSTNTHLRLLDAKHLANMFAHDCGIAAEVIELLAPHRKVVLPGKSEPVLLSESLKKQAAATSK